MVLSAPVYFDALVCVCESMLHPPPTRCARPLPLNSGGLYLCLCQLLCQLCKVRKQSSITERDEQAAAANREEHHQRSAETACTASIIIYLLFTAKTLLSVRDLKLDAVYTCTVHTEKKNCFVSTQYKLLYHLGAKLLN